MVEQWIINLRQEFDSLLRHPSAISSMVEHLLDTQEVIGSNPISRTNFMEFVMITAEHAFQERLIQTV
jgi:hypothetical protein